MTNLLLLKIVTVLVILLVSVLALTGMILTHITLYLLTYVVLLLVQLRVFIDVDKTSTLIVNQYKFLFVASLTLCAFSILCLLATIFGLMIVIPHVIILSFISLFILLQFRQLHIMYMNSMADRVAEQEVMAVKINDEKTAFQLQLQESQDELESKVQERTLELHVALQELGDVNRELAEKTTLDDLTTLYNRRFYDQRILAEFRRSRRNLSPLCLIIVDIDFFKKVNDTYGHIAGDECLKSVAQCLKQSLLRSADIACRYGGEEFCLIMPETTAKGAVAFANELRQKISLLTVHYQGEDISFTISCGVSCYQQQEGASPETLFSAADQALYQAKDQGRNQVQLADPILLKRIEE